MPFTPYWLIHEPGKEHGFAIVDLDSAITPERAIEVWRESDDYKKWVSLGVYFDAMPVEARLITEPFVTA